MRATPSYLDRYPAKMVTSLAEKIVDKYVLDNSKVLDPFCGSGVILQASQKKNCITYGVDINPYAILLSTVKLKGFNSEKAFQLWESVLSKSKELYYVKDETCKAIDYWFTPKTFEKLIRLKNSLKEFGLISSCEEYAVILAYALTIRLVSRADQRSPKPFISKIAIDQRKGKHFDPYIIMEKILTELSQLYGAELNFKVNLICENSINESNYNINKSSIDYVITSPPYINAQDYFRNSKLELFFLEGIFNFSMDEIKTSFIGTERGALEHKTFNLSHNYRTIFEEVENRNGRLGKVVLKYFSEIERVLKVTFTLLKRNGTLILVCGDNIVAGQKIPTWEILNQISDNLGYVIIDQFKDIITKRSLAPTRKGHKSFIKDETVTVFTKN